LKQDSRNLLRIVKISVLLVLILLSSVIFICSMDKPPSDGEQASCAAGVLLTKGQMIYKDFAHATQMPYYPFFCAAIFKIFNTAHYLLAARMLTVVCDILIVVCIMGIFARVFRSFPVTGLLLGMAMAVLYVFNWYADTFNGLALGRDFVMLCVAGSFWLFISIDSSQKYTYLRIGAMGALLTLASCLRLSAVFIQLLFFVMVLLQPAGSGKERGKRALAFLIATLVMLVLPLWTAIQAPRAFSINVFEMLSLKWRLMLRFHTMTAGTLDTKFAKLALCLTVPKAITPFVIAICVVVLIVLYRRKLDISHVGNAVLAILIPVILLITTLYPPLVLYKNFALLMPFVIISLAYPLLYLRRSGMGVGDHKLFNIVSIVVIGCTFSQVACQSFMLLRISRVFRPQTWIPVKLHQIARDVAENTKEPKLIVTMTPLYAFEGGCDIYPELSAGWMGCNIACQMPAAKREATKTLDADKFKEILAERPPSAIVIDAISSSSVGLIFLRIAKTKWPEQDYDKSVWERKEYPFVEDPNLVAYFRQ
jgi:hypothetical protein